LSNAHIIGVRFDTKITANTIPISIPHGEKRSLVEKLRRLLAKLRPKESVAIHFIHALIVPDTTSICDAALWENPLANFTRGGSGNLWQCSQQPTTYSASFLSTTLLRSCRASEGIAWIEDGIRDYRASESMLRMPYFLALKAEALHLTNRTSEALEAVTEAEEWVERSGERWWCAGLHRLRGVFLATLGAEETQIEASFCEAINTARKQKSVSLEKRAEATYGNTTAKKRAGQKDVDSDWLFGNAQ
jgi:hypothetical protein